MSNYLDDIAGKIKGYCALNPSGSRWSTVDGCIDFLMGDAAQSKANGTFDKKFGVGSPFSMAAPAKTTDDLFKSIQDLQQTFGQKLDLVDQQVNSANSKISNVSDNVSAAPAPASFGLGGLSTTTLLIIAAAVFVFLFRKKLF